MKRIGQFVSSLLLLLVSLSTHAVPGERVTYFHNDVYGSPVAATDANGNLLWTESYQPYGAKVQNSVSTAAQPIAYTGKVYDDTTGLMYFGARYYDPVLGRFTGMDAAGFEPTNIHSFNRYAYGNNNPYRYVDPDGNTPIEGAVSITIDVAILSVHVATGNYGEVPSDVINLTLDGVGAASPVPGTGAMLKAVRTADKVGSAAKILGNTVREARTVTGSYVIKFVTDAGKEMQYIGKGSIARAMQSAREKLAAEGGKVTSIAWESAKDAETAFKAEASKIEKVLQETGKKMKEVLYNQRNSPGKNM